MDRSCQAASDYAFEFLASAAEVEHETEAAARLVDRARAVIGGGASPPT